MNSQFNTPLYSRITSFSWSHGTILVAFLWGLAEATLFFLIPDIFLGFVALFNWRRGFLSTAFAVIGALIGGVVMFSLAINHPQLMNRILTTIPLINQEMVDSVRDAILSTGVISLITGPLQGIPYKVYAVQAGQQGLPIPLFLIMSMIARLERLLPVYLVGAIVGITFRDYVHHHTRLVIGMYIVFWLGVYTWYFLRFR